MEMSKALFSCDSITAVLADFFNPSDNGILPLFVDDILSLLGKSTKVPSNAVTSSKKYCLPPANSDHLGRCHP